MKIHKTVCFSFLVSLLTVVPSMAMKRISIDEKVENKKPNESNSNRNSMPGGALGLIEPFVFPKDKNNVPAPSKKVDQKPLLSLTNNELASRKRARESRLMKIRIQRDLAKRLRKEKFEREQKEAKEKEVQEKLEAQRKKEEREWSKKKAFGWGVLGFGAHVLTGLGTGYVVNRYEGGGGFFKKVLKPMINSFLTKQFLPLGGLYFSKYTFLQVGDMISDAIDPALDTTKKGLKDTVKELRPEFNGVLNDALWQLTDFKAELVENDLPMVLNEVDDKFANRVDDLMKKIPEAGDHLNNMAGKILDDNTPKVKRLMQEGTDSAFRGAVMAPVSMVKQITDQSPGELRRRKKRFDKNDETFDVDDIHKVGNVGMIVNAIERVTREQGKTPREKFGGKKKKTE